MDIKALSEIMSERNIPDVAFQLDTDSFAAVFRYAARYFIRNGISSCRVLFTLNQPDGTDETAYRDLCDEFGNHIRESLRKSDIFTRNRFNQYFVLITDIKEEFTGMVIHNIVAKWNAVHGDSILISYESEFVQNEKKYS